MSLQDVLLDELRDLYSAENQLVKALPKMAKGAQSAALRSSITNHLAETKSQIERLKQIFEHLKEKPTGKTRHGMQGLLEEGAEALEEDEGTERDIMITGASLRVEHYEKAGYTVAINLAQTLGEEQVVNLLQLTLAEEEAAAGSLTAQGLDLMKLAAADPEEDDEEEDEDEDDAEDEEEDEDDEDDEEVEDENLDDEDEDDEEEDEDDAEEVTAQKGKKPATAAKPARKPAPKTGTRDLR